MTTMPPVFPCMVAAILGILSARFLHFPLWVWWGALGCSVLAAIIRKWGMVPFWGVLFCAAALRLYAVDWHKALDPFCLLSHQKIEVTASALAESKETLTHGLVRVTRIATNKGWKSVETLLLADSPVPFPSTPFIAVGKLEPLPPAFDFYKRQGCRHYFVVERLQNDPASSSSLQKALTTLRTRLRRFTLASLPFPDGAIAMGILLGEHSQIPSGVLDEFRETGTYHVLVASGLKVALVAASAFALSWLFPFYYRLGFSAAAILIYVGLAGFGPPVERAAWMGSFGLLGFLFGRGKDSLSALFLAALILLLIHPDWLFDSGFECTFLSVLGIVLFYTPLSKALQLGLERIGSLPKRFVKYLSDSVAVTLTAQDKVLKKSKSTIVA